MDLVTRTSILNGYQTKLANPEKMKQLLAQGMPMKEAARAAYPDWSEEQVDALIARTQQGIKARMGGGPPAQAGGPPAEAGPVQKTAGINVHTLAYFRHYAATDFEKVARLQKLKAWAAKKAIQHGRHGGKAAQWGTDTMRQGGDLKALAKAQRSSANTALKPTISETLGMKNIPGFGAAGKRWAQNMSGSGTKGGAGGATAHKINAPAGGIGPKDVAGRVTGGGRDALGKMMPRHGGRRGMGTLKGDLAQAVGKSADTLQRTGQGIAAVSGGAMRGIKKYDKALTGGNQQWAGSAKGMARAVGYGAPVAALGGAGYALRG